MYKTHHLDHQQQLYDNVLKAIRNFFIQVGFVPNPTIYQHACMNLVGIMGLGIVITPNLETNPAMALSRWVISPTSG